jgi:hypothetical protein
MLSESRFYHFWVTFCMIFVLSFLWLVDMVHQDLLLADQYSKLKVSDVKFSLICCIGNDDELRLWSDKNAHFSQVSVDNILY